MEQAILIGDSQIFVEATGEVASLSELPRILEENPRYWIVGNTIGGHLARWHNANCDSPGWVIKVKTPRPPVSPWGHEHVMGVPQIRSIGWGAKRPGKQHTRSAAHPVLDFRHFHKATKDVHSLPDVVAMWGALRTFTHHMGIKMSPTAAGMGAIILKSMVDFSLDTRGQQRFARAALAAPLLNVYAETRKLYRRAVYLDQVRSWHVCAEAIRPPIAADWIDHKETRMRDQIADLLPINGVHEVTLRSGERVRLASNDGQLGLWSFPRAMKEVMEWHRGLGGRALFPLSRKHPIQDYAAEVMELYDTLLADRERIPERAVPVMKAVLLSVYGLLGFKDRAILSMGFNNGNGEKHAFSIHGETIHLATNIQGLAFERGNAIVLAMLRDEMHRRTALMMRRLRSLGFKVLAVFDDGIIVETDGKLPLLSEGWVIKHYIDDLVFWDEHNWRGDRLLRFGDGGLKETYLQEYKTLVEGRVVR